MEIFAPRFHCDCGVTRARALLTLYHRSTEKKNKRLKQNIYAHLYAIANEVVFASLYTRQKLCVRMWRVFLFVFFLVYRFNRERYELSKVRMRLVQAQFAY